MRKFVLIILLLSSAVYGQNTKPMPGEMIDWGHPLSKGLVGCWLFNEGTGNKIFDLSGNENRGTFQNDPIWSAGISGSCIEFDGINDYITVPDDASYDGHTKLTLASWVKTTETSAYIFWKGHSSPYDFQYALDISNSKARMVAYTSVGNVHFNASGTSNINDDAWHFLVGTVEANKEAKIYVDGILDGYDSTSYSSWNYEGARDLHIGRRDGVTNYLDGLIDSPMIWKRVLTASEIALLSREPFCMFESSPGDSSLYGAVSQSSSPNGQVILIQMGTIPLFLLGFCILIKKRK